jgi:hypothetical protein
MMIWERSDSMNGPWVAVNASRVPKSVVRKAKRQDYDCSGKLVPRYQPGDPIVACRYYYRYVTAAPASES